MSFISNKSQKTPHSVIREMFAMQAGLDNVISFALGEPDFTAPQHVIDATVASLQRGETHYTPNAGIPALRQAVSDLYKRRGLEYKPSEILIGAGAISMLNLACTAMLDIGDEVLVPDPGWANYVGLMMQVGAVPVPVRLKEENGFMYDVADLRAALTPKTKVILLNSPSNPTGGVASAENLRQLADFAKENDLYILTDEIYRELLWDDEPYTSIASFPGMKERTVIVDGFSKTYAIRRRVYAPYRGDHRRRAERHEGRQLPYAQGRVLRLPQYLPAGYSLPGVCHASSEGEARGGRPRHRLRRGRRGLRPSGVCHQRGQHPRGLEAHP